MVNSCCYQHKASGIEQVLGQAHLCSHHQRCRRNKSPLSGFEAFGNQTLLHEKLTRQKVNFWFVVCFLLFCFIIKNLFVYDCRNIALTELQSYCFYMKWHSIYFQADLLRPGLMKRLIRLQWCIKMESTCLEKAWWSLNSATKQTNNSLHCSFRSSTPTFMDVRRKSTNTNNWTSWPKEQYGGIQSVFRSCNKSVTLNRL